MIGLDIKKDMRTRGIEAGAAGTRMLVIKGQKGGESLFHQFLTRREFEYIIDTDHKKVLSEWTEIWKVGNGGLGTYPGGILDRDGSLNSIIRDEDMSQSFFFEGGLEGRDNLSWERQLAGLYRLAAAKKVLGDLNHYCEHKFREEFLALEEKIAVREAFFNTSLIYFIAATDNNEDTLGHSQFVASYTLLLARALGVEDSGFLMDLDRGALLHDIGKIGIPESILRKSGSLTVIEKEIVKDHPLLGFNMVREFDFLKNASRVVLFHHEQYDGKGYPYGLSGEEIPLEARIFALADTLDAITSDRPYRKGRGFEDARREIERGEGSQFDPLIVDVFLSIPKEKWQQAKRDTSHSLRVPTIH